MNEARITRRLQANNLAANVDALWLRHYAYDFLSAAQTFKAPVNRFSPVPYYLVCRSIELSLKSFLCTAGFNKKQRKDLRHNLEKVLSKAEKNGLISHLTIAPKDQELIRKANSLYNRKQFEYFERLETVYDPYDFDLDPLTSFARRLFEATEKPVRAYTQPFSC